jgi:cytidylate kinase
MPVIAFTQEMGSLAKDVALRLAEEMELDTLRHEVVEHAASLMHVPKSLINRLREGKAGPIERLKVDRQSLAVYAAEELLEAAARGNIVLRGWGATCLLRPVPHVLCVRVTRSFDRRVDWLMTHFETDDRDFAENEVRRSDHAHAARMHELFGVTWGDPLLYDLVLNTDRLSIESCVQTIRHLVGRPEFAETPESAAQIAGMAIEAHIRSALRSNEQTHGVNITIECRHGQVVLSGIVISEQERQLTEQLAAAVRGVASVDNQLRVMRMPRIFPSSKT